MEKKQKIIVISGDTDSVKRLNNIFKNYKCEVINVKNNIRKAKENILLADFDFYFIDTLIDIEDLSYLIDLIKDLKSKYKIIIMSHNLTQEAERRIRSYGITYLLKKPFSTKEVKELLEY